MLTTSFDLARQTGACVTSYGRFAECVGGVGHYGRTTPIPITEVLEALGVRDALWCLSNAVPEDQGTAAERLLRLFACDCAVRVLPIFETVYPGDNPPRQAIEVSRRFSLGLATQEELYAAWGAAWAAAAKSTGAARTAALAAAGAAGRAAWSAAAETAWVVSRDAEGRWQGERFQELLIQEGGYTDA